jgi:hypothetical protein
MTDGKPSIADPMAVIAFLETPTYMQGHPKAGELGPIHYWIGWRPRLLRWLINRWMPNPTVWNR